MWPTWQSKVDELDSGLEAFSEVRPLPGIAKSARRVALAWQMVASLRRLAYTAKRKERDISPHRADPSHAMFDPEMAAMLHYRAGRVDEAFWLVFLSTHFGKHRRHGWRLLRDVYSGLGQSSWTWSRVSQSPAAFGDWLDQNREELGGAFGNHRKYETLKATSKGTAAIVAAYVNWVGPNRSHAELVARLILDGGNDPHTIFDHFYRSMTVPRFGRLAKFDFLAMIGRLGFAPIEPGSAYIREASGPLLGARLLFVGDATDGRSDKYLDQWVIELGAALELGMQELEDSICNWQKSPEKFIHFRG